MEPSDLLLHFVEILERLGIPYLVTGSMATTAYGEPRFTNDLDVVVDLRPEQVDAFCQSFPATEFYCYREAVLQAVQQRFQFNIVHFESGIKIDVFIPELSLFNQSFLSRGKRLTLGSGFDVRFASPEDVILKKLEYFREGGSEKHVRDIIGVLKVQAERIDREYIAAWASRLGLAETWQDVLQRIENP
jgi:hypothetical protein